MKIRRRRGFTIIESLIYIFMTTLILNEGLYLTVLIYKSYLYNAEITKEYNDIQNFYLEFDNIIFETNIEKIKLMDNKLVFLKNVKKMEKEKLIKYKPDEKAVVVKYDASTENKMLGDMSDMSFVQKDKLIYMIIRDENGKEFISCV